MMALSFNKDFRLPENQYIQGKSKKSGICVHHTVGGTALSTFNWWNSNVDKVGTPYIIDRDGTLLEVFGPENWAWEFGLDWGDPARTNFESRFIGIELASEGRILERDGIFYRFGNISPNNIKPADQVFDAGSDYRGYRYFDRYEPAQIETLTQLINHLCDQFSIPRRMLPKPMEFYGRDIKDFRGIIGHVNVRKDKTDPAPVPALWETLQAECNLSVEGAPPDHQTNTPPEKMTDKEINDLFHDNLLELDKMYVPAGSMVKNLIMELERNGRNTYIKLRDAEPVGHIIFYDFLEGDEELISKVAIALGFKQVTSNKLEVNHA